MKNLIIIFCFCVILPFTLGSCGRQKAQPADTGAISETRTVNTLRGAVSIPVNPQRIADASGISDMLCIIERKPVATSDSDAYDYTRFPSYLEDMLAGAVIIGYPMADTVNVEAVLAAEPDLIIINPRQEKAYGQLQAVAPTIIIEPTVNDWRGDLRMVGELFDSGAAVEAYIADYETQAREAGAAIKAANGPDATYFSFLTAGNSYYLFTGAAYGDMFYNDMGLGIPQGLPEQDNISLPTASLEGLTGINADYMVVLASPDDRAALEASSVWNSMESVKAGRVIWLPQSPYFNQAYSVYGKKLLLDELKTLLIQ
ncbi:MAG: ABC transporter substrate-binding protein [Spirochaetaceae bacterium]|jgi:iron complex transport system substrate-binding protein|nr:ABC transporter substrate-binding protein [Spirochaetaceae bacterium]